MSDIRALDKAFSDILHLQWKSEKEHNKYLDMLEQRKYPLNKGFSQASDALSFIDGVPETMSWYLNVMDVLTKPTKENITEAGIETVLDLLPPGVDQAVTSAYYANKYGMLDHKFVPKTEESKFYEYSDNTRTQKPQLMPRIKKK